MRAALAGREALLRAAIEDGDLEATVKGSSMLPELAPESRITISRARLLLPGDVLVFRGAEGHLVSHRLLGFVWRNGLRLVAKGDGAESFDDFVLPGAVIGKIRGSVSPGQRLRALWNYARFLVRAACRRHAHGIR